MAHSLLAVFAHPDDESLASGGLLARCAEAGVRVALLCLTRGEHGPWGGGPEGERGGRAGPGESLGDVRARELSEAARALGLHEVLLLDHEDGMLPWLDAALLERDVLGAIRRVQPDVVVTFDQDGLYGHPDHVAVHERVTAAVRSLGASGPALYYVSMPAGSMRGLAEAAPDAPRPVFGIDDPSAFGAEAPAPTLVVQAGGLAVRKLAALRCHRTQVGGSALDALDEREAARFLGTEHYRRARVGRARESFLERLGSPAAPTAPVGRS